MSEVQKILIEDERLKLYDRDACSEIWREARDFFVDQPDTCLSRAWASPRVTPVIQPIYDYINQEGAILRNEPDFRFAVAGIRKCDGVTFSVTAVICVRFKGHREEMLSVFLRARGLMESYAECCCKFGQSCAEHQDSVTNESLISA